MGCWPGNQQATARNQITAQQGADPTLTLPLTLSPHPHQVGAQRGARGGRRDAQVAAARHEPRRQGQGHDALRHGEGHRDGQDAGRHPRQAPGRHPEAVTLPSIEP
eukprot:scaffold109798_cov39-Phaeocystis_antarctica.AAC.1